ncbi:hypothetical protein HHU12_27500 [Flammeovirga aprica JL-4]|uniref:Uncharacterized protein n=1 Tax=Flammeovirga aprica JL-4 TaxID=694437 RepID=A0A7X9XCF3_9BACT|nr:hypothetical protein [Flammeovirga aprica]NME71742.1 hypothetical protein [Flammeovirga aprica JL-4]
MDSHIFVVKTETGEILSHYFESHKTNNWMSDAVVLTEIKIDTAPYIFNSSTRAFGVRVFFLGSSNINQYSQELISLFVEKDDALTPVLHQYPIENYGGEWDGECVGEFTSERKIIMISDQKSNGFNNIVIKNKITDNINFLEGDECKNKAKISYQKDTLKYDGSVYKK